MAKPIKDTPILSGKDAQAFWAKAKENECKRISKEEYDRILSNFKKVRICI